MLQTKGHLVPCLLLVAIIGIGASGLGSQAESAPVDPRPLAVEAPAVTGVTVHCDLRRGFALHLAMKAQRLLRAIVPGANHADHARGATCQVHQDRS